MSTLQLRSSAATLAGGAGRTATGTDHAARGRELLHKGTETLLTWLERAHQRRHLRMLSDHMLHDIGLSRADVESEAGKPFWRP
jgi:uncharacterized protein YjiS (DUF1127 family)